MGSCGPLLAGFGAKQYIHGILGADDAPGISAVPIAMDPERLRIDFLPYEGRTVQAEGIEWDKIQYQSGVLVGWIGAKEPGMKRYGRRFIVRRDCARASRFSRVGRSFSGLRGGA